MEAGMCQAKKTNITQEDIEAEIRAVREGK